MVHLVLLDTIQKTITHLLHIPSCQEQPAKWRFAQSCAHMCKVISYFRVNAHMSDFKLHEGIKSICGRRVYAEQYERYSKYYCGKRRGNKVKRLSDIIGWEVLFFSSFISAAQRNPTCFTHSRDWSMREKSFQLYATQRVRHKECKSDF